LETLAVAAAAALVTSVLVAMVGSAEAAFRGSNGKVAFVTNREGDFEIYNHGRQRR